MLNFNSKSKVSCTYTTVITKSEIFFCRYKIILCIIMFQILPSASSDINQDIDQGIQMCNQFIFQFEEKIQLIFNDTVSGDSDIDL